MTILDRLKSFTRNKYVAGLAGITGFLVSYSYVFYIIGAYASSCGHRREDAYLSALILGACTVTLAVLLQHLGRQHARILRWFVMPHVVTIGFVISMVPGYLARVTVQGEHLCSQGRAGFGRSWPDALSWHKYYALALLFYVLLYAGYMLWYWQQGSSGRQPARTTEDSHSNRSTQWKFLGATFGGFLLVCIAGSGVAEIWFQGSFDNFLAGAFVAPGGPLSWFIFQQDLALAIKVSAVSLPLLFLMGLHAYLDQFWGRWASFTGVFLWFMLGAMSLRYIAG